MDPPTFSPHWKGEPAARQPAPFELLAVTAFLALLICPPFRSWSLLPLSFINLFGGLHFLASPPQPKSHVTREFCFHKTWFVFIFLKCDFFLLL